MKRIDSQQLLSKGVSLHQKRVLLTAGIGGASVKRCAGAMPRWYRTDDRKVKGRIPDEFVALTV